MDFSRIPVCEKLFWERERTLASQISNMPRIKAENFGILELPTLYSFGNHPNYQHLFAYMEFLPDKELAEWISGNIHGILGYFGDQDF